MLSNFQNAQEVPMQYLGVSSESFSSTQALELPVLPCIVSLKNNSLSAELDDRPLRTDEIHANIAGFIAIDEREHQNLMEVSAVWETTYGDKPPAVLNLSRVAESKRRETALEWLATELATARAAQAHRNIRLSRDLVELRRNHESTQAAFERLEAFFYDVVKFERWQDFILAPTPGAKEAVLNDGDVVLQRLPRSSVGLSDLTLQFADPVPRKDGVLKVALCNLEENKPIACWKINAKQFDESELRLSLKTALGDDPISLGLDLEWEGSEPLRLKTSMQHPDPRFQSFLNSKPQETVLALTAHRYIAGSAAPVPAKAFASDTVASNLLLVPSTMLSEAIDLKTGKKNSEVFVDQGSIQIHVALDSISANVLRSVCAAGTQTIVAKVQTFHEDAPNIEYALGALPRQNRGNLASLEKDLADHHFSGWTCLAPTSPGELRMEIPEGLPETCDLYLMTRLAEGEDRIDFGWARFSGITLHSDGATS